jgi:hypothetical protein
MVRRIIEEDRPLFLRRIADHSDAEGELAIKTFEDSIRSSKGKLDVLLAEQGRR